MNRAPDRSVVKWWKIIKLEIHNSYGSYTMLNIARLFPEKVFEKWAQLWLKHIGEVYKKSSNEFILKTAIEKIKFDCQNGNHKSRACLGPSELFHKIIGKKDVKKRCKNKKDSNKKETQKQKNPSI